MIIREGVMLPSERLDYSAIGQRSKLALPNSARLAVWVIVNVEEWDPSQPMPRTVITPPAGGAPMPDIPMMIVQHHEGEYLLQRAIDQFDRLYAEGKERAKIMALAIHPYISGQPHRIKYLEAIYDYASRFDGVLHWNGLEILDWYLSVRR